MFKWFTVEKVRTGLSFLWIGLMVLTLFLGRIDLSIFAVLMLVLMELESINRKMNSES
jgi:hypothetical protein